MKIVYAVSVNTHAMSMLRTQRPRNLLLSYAYANALGQVPYEPDLLMLDSGAFSAWNAERPTDLFGYGRFAEQICGARRNKPSYVINLDVIPGKVGKTSSEDERRTGMAESLRNADVLRERFSLPIAEVFHQDEPWEYLDRLVSRMPKDGLLCLSPRNDVSVTERARWCWSVTDYWRGKLGDIRRFPRCHGLAVTARECLTVFPFYTVDSSTWFVAFRFGRKIRADGAQIDFTSVTSLPSSRVLPAQKLVVAQSMANLEQLERFGTELWARRGLSWSSPLCGC
jgi:hypothetical protein